MPTSVIMPALGVAQQTGILIKWLKAEGEAVCQGEPLMEIETDKATVEVEAPASGVLVHVTASPGDEVPVGNCIAFILAPGEAADAPVPHRAAARVHSGASPVPPIESEKKGPTYPRPPIQPEFKRPLGATGGRADVAPAAVRPASGELEQSPGRILASPAAKRIAREYGLELGSLKGSGPQGSILMRDVMRVARPATPESRQRPADTAQPLRAMRRVTGERLTQSQSTAPQFYLSVDIAATSLIKARSEWRKQTEPPPSINDFILHACAEALRDFPSVNSRFTEQGIVTCCDINIGMAVALDEGLIVPVIHCADQLTLQELAAASRELIVKAQNKSLLPHESEDGTFTVSNLGMLGIDNFVAAIHPPQAAALAIGRIAERVTSDHAMFAIKAMMTATLSADHRALDEAIGARFLRRLKTILEATGR